MATVEIQTPFITGQFDASLVDVSGIGSQNIVRADEEWRIDLTWHIDGFWAKFLTGKWRVQAQLQGSDDVVSELRRPAVPVDVLLDGRSGPGSPYTASIVFPAGTFAGLLSPARDSFVFGVIATLNYRTSANVSGPMAAFVDLGNVQVYDD